jgi:hypothetical protein
MVKRFLFFLFKFLFHRRDEMSDPEPMEIDPNNPAGATQDTPQTPQTPFADSLPVSDAVWESALNVWINAHVRNSPIAGATEAWNHLMGALPDLKVALNIALGKKE